MPIAIPEAKRVRSNHCTTIGGRISRPLNNPQEIRHFGLFDYQKARWRAIAGEYVSFGVSG